MCHPSAENSHSFAPFRSVPALSAKAADCAPLPTIFTAPIDCMKWLASRTRSRSLVKHSLSATSSRSRVFCPQLTFHTDWALGEQSARPLRSVRPLFVRDARFYFEPSLQIGNGDWG